MEKVEALLLIPLAFGSLMDLNHIPGRLGDWLSIGYIAIPGEGPGKLCPYEGLAFSAPGFPECSRLPVVTWDASRPIKNHGFCVSFSLALLRVLSPLTLQLMVKRCSWWVPLRAVSGSLSWKVLMLLWRLCSLAACTEAWWNPLKAGARNGMHLTGAPCSRGEEDFCWVWLTSHS